LKRSPQFVGLLGVLAIVMPLALAQETHVTQENGAWTQVSSGSLSAAKNIRVRVDMGSVVVHGSKQAGIDYSLHLQSAGSSEQDAKREFEGYKLTTYVRGDTAWVVGEWRGTHSVHAGSVRMSISSGPGHKFSGEFVINVPRETESLRVETGGGGVETTGVAGRVDIQTGGGKIQADDIGGPLNAETGGDAINVGSVGGDVKVQTGGGSITIHSAKGNIMAATGGGNVTVLSGEQNAVLEAGGGNVEIKRCAGRVKANTGGGSIELGDIGGGAEVETAGGSIRLTSAKGAVRAHTGGGSIDLYGVPSARAETGAGGITVKLVNTGGERSDSMIETAAGDITVYIASDVALTVRASVDLGNGHRISSELPDIHVASAGDQWGPRTLNAEGKLNGGGPVLKVRTTTGDICFRRAK
jgi:DUF4097 and DUF4098 domain-containing protein YvlB